MLFVHFMEEIDAPSAPSAKTGPGRRGAIVLAMVIPFAAAFGYLELGNPQGLESGQVSAHQQSRELDAVLARLVEGSRPTPATPRAG